MVHLDSESIDRCMDAARDAIRLDPGLREELRASRSDFFPGQIGLRASADETRLAERRHLEWFLTERPSGPSQRDRIDGLLAQSASQSGVDPEDWKAALDGSRASFFEVTAITPGQEWTLLDLAGLFECRVLSAAGNGVLAVGDVVAGRVFPVENHRYALSRAASIWRSPALLAAMRSDLERARAGRSPRRQGRSELRQSEIETILHAWANEASGGRVRVDGAVARARALFCENGLSLEDADELLALLAREAPDPTRILPGGGDVLGDVLVALAFETRVDLEAARALLIEAWDELHPVAREPRPLDAEVQDAAAPRLDTAAAIAEFDRKRRAGTPLDEALRDLERDLDLEDEESRDDLDEEAESTLELPGVVGGVVEEFLWDEGRVHGEDQARRYQALRGLGLSAGQVSVFESLGRRELTDFACRYAIEVGGLRDAEDAELLLEGLDRFCSWAEENHDVPLHKEFAPVLTGLQESLPRVALANRACSVAADPGKLEWLELVERRGTGEAIVADLGGRSRAAEISAAILEHLHPGDLIRGEEVGGRRLKVGACYPAALRQVLTD